MIKMIVEYDFPMVTNDVTPQVNDYSHFIYLFRAQKSTWYILGHVNKHSHFIQITWKNSQRE